jgi:putative nucleotidyltransferase with HDIG domain
MAVTVELDDLRVGMFVHLDVGWMSHPFPLSSFKITSPDQIATIRGLGLKKLRWSPERSDAAPAADPEVSERLVGPDLQAVHAPAAPAELDPAERARQVRARQLSEQTEAARLCERQYGEACRDLRRVNDAVVGEPLQARDSAQQLTQALLDKMLVDDELCVRVLGEPQGDRVSSHAMNVAIISMLLGRALSLAPAELADLGLGALLHDVGKLVLPDRLRLPYDDFSTSELKAYREHVAHGLVQGRRMGLTPGALLIIAQHHEHADASGYPKGVALERMSLAARIVAMVNHYDNLCNAAVPAQSLTPHEALSRMFAQLRSHFDATLLNAFIRLMGIYPPGSVVQLSDDRYAMVMTVNSARPLKPKVLVFDPAVPVEQALHLNLETTPDLGIRRSLKSEQLPAKAVDYLAPRQRVAYFFGADAVPVDLA